MQDLIDAGEEGASTLADLADELKDKPLALVASTAVAEAIDQLTGGEIEVYVNTRGDGITRVAVLTDDFTVRVLMLTTTWKWRGPYTPEEPEAWLTDRGYIPVPEVTADA